MTAITDMIAAAGLELTPWQARILAEMFRQNPDGSWAAEHLQVASPPRPRGLAAGGQDNGSTTDLVIWDEAW
jgi:hypothetical protein